MEYCQSSSATRRFKTREVKIGNVGVGADNPIRIQSMTTSDTRDVHATVEQVIRLAHQGCEIVRVTVQGMKEAEACEEIKNELLRRGCDVPLVADIHFYPPAALQVIDFVDKVRINPGNFVDKRATFKEIIYTDESYAEEIHRIEEKFTPLVEKCKRLNKAMRIGVNHGSLSDRILNRYGDTPKGMIESAFEFARVCRKHDFHQFIFSMKSSNPLVMIHAYRLLVAEMMQLGWDYPLHLGVTEAGEGEDGRVKSAIGIGSLLLDGIGDTIRVSLTEDPWFEIDPCLRLKVLAEQYAAQRPGLSFRESTRDFNAITRRIVSLSNQIALHRDGSVFLRADQIQNDPVLISSLGCTFKGSKPSLKVDTVDTVVLSKSAESDPNLLQNLQETGIGFLTDSPNPHGLLQIQTLAEAVAKEIRLKFMTTSSFESAPTIIRIADEDPVQWSALKGLKPDLLFFSPSTDRVHRARHFFDWLRSQGVSTPVILNFAYDLPWEDMIIHAAAECGSLLCDGLGEGVLLEGPYSLDKLRVLSFSILQSARMRTFKTDFISCPSCGRTLFNLQEVSRQIREKTDHLPGVKIAIMGCIVNGPGEMADADFGYVGSRPGMIDLYVGKQCVEKNIAHDQAVERLIDLIKRHGRWVPAATE